MPFTLPSIMSWLKHRVLGFQRILSRMQSNHFLARNANLTQLMDLDGEALFCPICGFSMAELLLEQGWSAWGCSATALKADFKLNAAISFFKPTSKPDFNNNLSI